MLIQAHTTGSELMFSLSPNRKHGVRNGPQPGGLGKSSLIDGHPDLSLALSGGRGTWVIYYSDLLLKQLYVGVSRQFE